VKHTVFLCITLYVGPVKPEIRITRVRVRKPVGRHPLSNRGRKEKWPRIECDVKSPLCQNPYRWPKYRVVSSISRLSQYTLWDFHGHFYTLCYRGTGPRHTLNVKTFRPQIIDEVDDHVWSL